MKYGTSKLTGATDGAFIRVTFENGTDNPSIHVEGLIGDGGGSQYSASVCMLEAITNLFIDKCEGVKGTACNVVNHNIKF